MLDIGLVSCYGISCIIWCNLVNFGKVSYFFYCYMISILEDDKLGFFFYLGCWGKKEGGGGFIIVLLEFLILFF